MKSLFFFYSILCLPIIATAQSIFTIEPGTDVTIAPGTIFHAGGLSLTPTTPFAMNNLSLVRSPSLAQTTSNPAIERSYRFVGAAPAFSGAILFQYDDGELNSIQESELQLNIFNGTAWQALPDYTNDPINNTLFTPFMDGIALQELSLASVNFSLPLKFGHLQAFRQAKYIRVEWSTLLEWNLSHFDIQRSWDAINWTTIKNDIPAGNTSLRQVYQHLDNDYSTQRLYYRIKIAEKDGTHSYSPVYVLSEDKRGEDYVIFPNPVLHSFKIQTDAATSIKQILLFNNAGALVKTWSEFRSDYSMQDLPSGIYSLLIQKQDGSILNKLIVKL